MPGNTALDQIQAIFAPYGTMLDANIMPPRKPGQMGVWHGRQAGVSRSVAAQLPRLLLALGCVAAGLLACTWKRAPDSWHHAHPRAPLHRQAVRS